MALDMPDGTTCFVDSNIWYYALIPTLGPTQHCLELIDRAIAGRASLATSIPIICEVMHKVMISEAAQVTGRDRAGMIGFLNKHPEFITRMVEYPQVVERLSMIPMSLLSVDLALLQDVARLAVQYELLTNDATVVALMKRHGLDHLANNDDDLDGIAGVTVWKPR